LKSEKGGRQYWRSVKRSYIKTLGEDSWEKRGKEIVVRVGRGKVRASRADPNKTNKGTWVAEGVENNVDGASVFGTKR